MTAITRPAFRRDRPWRDSAVSPAATPTSRMGPPAFVAVLALAAVWYLWNLTISGYANTYYSAAALAVGKLVRRWFFGTASTRTTSSRSTSRRSTRC